MNRQGKWKNSTKESNRCSKSIGAKLLWSGVDPKFVRGTAQCKSCFALSIDYTLKVEEASQVRFPFVHPCYPVEQKETDHHDSIRGCSSRL